MTIRSALEISCKALTIKFHAFGITAVAGLFLLRKLCVDHFQIQNQIQPSKRQGPNNRGGQGQRKKQNSWKHNPKYFKFYNCIESIIWMPQLFPFVRCHQVPTLEYQSHKFGYALGEICKNCDGLIAYEHAITVCGCQRYSHKKCLVEDLSKENLSEQKCDFKCRECQKFLQVYYEQETKLKCCLRVRNLVGLIVSSILCLSAFVCLFKSRSSLGGLLCSFLYLTFSFTFFFIFLANLIVQRACKLRGIMATNLSLVVSAFVGINSKRYEEQEETKTQMIYR